MKVIDVAEKRRLEEARAENEAKMPSVIENELFKLELKNGKIESINIAMMPLDGEACIGMCGGNLETTMRRTADCLVNLATMAVTQVGMNERAVRGMLRAVLDQALMMVEIGTAKVDKREDSVVIEFGDDEE